MSYNPSIPNPTDFLSDSQGQIKTNFTAINAGLAINHYPLSPNTTDTGKHKYVQLPENAAIATLVNENLLFTQPVGGVTQLFVKGETNGSEYQLTSIASGIDPNFSTFGTNGVYTTVGPISFSGGWTFLPGGLLLQYGTVTNANGNAQTAVPFPKSFKSTTVPFSIVTTMIRTGAGADVIYVVPTSPTDIDFDVFNTSGNPRPFYWYAIGQA